MPVIYCLIAHGTMPLAEYSRASGNFTKIAHQLLAKIPKHNTKMTYKADHHTFNYIVQDEVVFLCLADEESGSPVPFLYLKAVHKDFEAMFGASGKKATKNLEFNQRFSSVLRKHMVRASSPAAC